MRQIRQRVLAWYDAHARVLPWRQTRDPYAIWVSEIMLQQTQVATVIDYFNRFMAAIPDIASLATADEQEVLRLWSGLGYYRRAKQMHAAAKQIVTESGSFPNTVAEMQKLPGIGRYTAGAIASFAFDLPAPIVEANTLRLFSRLLHLEIDPRSREGQTQLWELAETLVASYSKTGAGRVNQALMEVGSQVCTPRNPDCPNCPINQYCPTFASGSQDSIPLAAVKQSVTDLTHAALVITHDNCILMRQNSAEDWWHGLWDFPRIDISGERVFLPRSKKPSVVSRSEREWIAVEFLRQHQLQCSVARHHGTLKHAVTRYRITLHTFAATVPDRSLSNPLQAWHSLDSLRNLPLTAPASRILKSL